MNYNDIDWDLGSNLSSIILSMSSLSIVLLLLSINTHYTFEAVICLNKYLKEIPESRFYLAYNLLHALCLISIEYFLSFKANEEC